MEGKILLMQEIRLRLEKLTKENFDNFIVLYKKSIGSERSCYLDTTKINRLKEDAFSINPKYEAYLGGISLDWVAYAIIIKSYSTFTALPKLIIEEIFVVDNFRNLGIGTAMFEFCVRKAKKKSCGMIELTVPNKNEKAKFFFEFNGVIPVDTTYYQIDPFDTK